MMEVLLHCLEVGVEDGWDGVIAELVKGKGEKAGLVKLFVDYLCGESKINIARFKNG